MKKDYHRPTITSYVNKQQGIKQISGGEARVLNFKAIDKPVVTIFTVVLNAQNLLQATINSVSSQTYKNIQYIIIDGESTDGTLEIIKKNSKEIHIWISEKDSGTADATNKAISLSSGKYVYWLSAGDTIDRDYIELAVRGLQTTGADFVFGRVTYYDGNNRLYTEEADRDYENTKYFYPQLNYQTWVIKKECFEKIGLLDTRYKVFCDFEWGLQLRKQGGRGYYMENLNINFLRSGLTEKNLIRGEFEGCQIIHKNGINLGVAISFFLYRIIRTYTRRFLKITLPVVIYEKIHRIVRGKAIVNKVN